MKSDAVIAAFRHLLSGRREEGINLIRQIAAAEQRNGNTNLGHRIGRLLDSTDTLRPLEIHNAPNDVQISESTRALSSIICSDENRSSIQRIISEWHAREALSAHGIAPRNVLLLSGPSGNGKTSIAQALARELMLPFALVRYHKVIESHLGETSRGIGRIFDFASRVPCLLFFDEADSIITARSSGPESALRETNLSVNQLLMKLDALPPTSFVVFATNREAVLDSALVRRVHLSLHIGVPSASERESMIALCNSRWPVAVGRWESSITDAKSFAAIESAALDAARAAIISGAHA